MSKFEKWFIRQFLFSAEQFEEFFQMEDGKYIPKFNDPDVIAYAFRVNFMWSAWKARQSEIEQLKAQLNNMEQCYIEMKKQLQTVGES